MAKTSYSIDRIEPTLPSERSIELIEKQMDKIDGLLQLRYDDPEVTKWNNLTEQILIKAFGKPHDNINAFYSAKNGGSVFGGTDEQFQAEYLENLENIRKLFESFIEQLDIFSPVPTLTEKAVKSKELSKKMFIVHGHDDKAKSELALILSRLGMEPIILHEKANEGMTIIEKLEKHSDVGYAFVILTPDDLGANASEINTDKDLGNLKPRARQNVVFEQGLFVGKLQRKHVCCLYKGAVELPSDLHGLVYLPFTDSINEVQIDIIKELRAVGYDVNI